MTDNELIAEWLDWKLGEDTLLIWNDCITCGKPTGERFVVFSPETDINLWHGSDGLLQNIKDKGLLTKFTDHLIAGCGIFVEIEHDGSMWLPIERVPELVLAGTEQLTAALVAVIKEE